MAPGVVCLPDSKDGVQDLRVRAVLDDPIMGKEVTIVGDNGPGALAVRPLPPPQQPAPQAMARHLPIGANSALHFASRAITTAAVGLMEGNCS